jgi:hypothetical protein
MIPKKPAPDLIGGGNRFSEKDHAQTKSQTMIPIQPDRIMVWPPRNEMTVNKSNHLAG